ncbi:MAG: class I SAM-dependent methyltransferase [Candidatus Promineifilaceae bacterium]
MELINYPCPSCSAEQMARFYEVKNVPVHSVILVPTRVKAMTFPRGEIVLAFCPECGFITNTAFDAGLLDYSGDYESTQAFSATFNRFHHNLANSLIERYDLHQKDVIEIGCGQGEFLKLLCELGDNRGVGFDPAYEAGNGVGHFMNGKISFIADYYSEKYADFKGDFICCKMTLEHIHNTFEFVSTVRRSVGEDAETVIFFQVPNARYVFGEVAFWDIYYEHCSYFSQGSMARLFRKAGFDIINLWTDYDDQYLMIEARPGQEKPTAPLPQEGDLDELLKEVIHFESSVRPIQDKWRTDIAKMQADGRKIVLWGGGSKAVSFLTTLGLGLDVIQYVVDINPNKTGTFLAASGQETVAPHFLTTYKPDTVIIMNPIYRKEITETLESMGLSPEILTV